MTATAQRNLTHTLAPQARERLGNARFSTWEIAARAAQQFTEHTGHRPMIRRDLSTRRGTRWHLDLTGAPPPGRITIRSHLQRGKDKRDAGTSLVLKHYPQIIACDGSATTTSKGTQAARAMVTSDGLYQLAPVQASAPSAALLAEACALAYALIHAATCGHGRRSLILLDCFALIQGGDPVGFIRSLAKSHPGAGIPIAKLTTALAHHSYAIDLAHVRSHQPLEANLPARTWIELADALAGSLHGGTASRGVVIAQCMELLELDELHTRTPHLDVTMRRI